MPIFFKRIFCLVGMFIIIVSVLSGSALADLGYQHKAGHFS